MSSPLRRNRLFQNYLVQSMVFIVPASMSQIAFAQHNRIDTRMTIDILDRISMSSSVDGVIESISVRPGETVSKDQKMVQLDTHRLEKQVSVAKYEYGALRTKSENDSREKSSRAREKSARFNVMKLNEVATDYQIDVPQLELVRAQSELDEASSERLGARKELNQYRYEAEAKQREIELLKFDIDKSVIYSPFDGAMTRVDKRPGEFVQKGETIAELYRLDVLCGVLLIDREQLPPERAENVKGSLVIEDPWGERSFPVVIKRVLPRIDIDGRYRAFVEFHNVKTDEGKWTLLPGMVGRAVFDLPLPMHDETSFKITRRS